jgi:uncharacterized membrane protein YqaE (UPF0057 family)
MVFKLGIPGICFATFLSNVLLCMLSYLILMRKGESIKNK